MCYRQAFGGDWGNRVSSDRQTIENQRFEITNFCEGKQLHIDGWIQETISGTKRYDKRELGRSKGRRNNPDKYKLSGKVAYIRRMLRKGIYKNELARRCHVDRHTLDRFLTANTCIIA